MNDDKLRSAYRGLIVRPGEGRQECPAPEDIDAVVARRGSEDSRMVILNHATSCAECRRELDMLRAIQGSRPARAWRAPVFALAAVATLVVGAGLFFRAGEITRSDLLRGEPPALILVDPDEMAYATTPVRLEWRAVEGASEYRVEVLDAAGAVVVSTRSTQTAMTLPADALPPADSAYLWRVIADLANGGYVSSPLKRFFVTAP